MKSKMKYIVICFEGQSIYIELDEQKNAVRQLNIDEDSVNHVSCREDCLAEGNIFKADIEGDFQYISGEDFEIKWLSAMKTYEMDWKQIKRKYQIGNKVVGKSLFFYPQGTVIKGQDFYAIYKGDKIKCINQEIVACIKEYDEKNMWLVLV